MTRPRYDAVIAGGGCSGLSLAARLAAGAWRDRRVLLVDDEGATSPARCWAFWSPLPGPPVTEPLPGPLSAAVSESYERMRVHAGGRAMTLPLGGYRYRVVHREGLRRAVLGQLADRTGFEVRTGTVEAVRDAGDHAEVIVDGEVVRAGWAFDSVTHHGRAGAASGRRDGGRCRRSIDARLAFTGWQVRSPVPVFDPLTPVLFDFRTPQRGGSRFVYVLPSDPYQALVELTSFVPRRGEVPGPGAREGALRAYLRDVLGCPGYQVLRSESAVLPLRAFPPPRRQGRVLCIGAAGGLVKASTGYAFQRIQRDSEAIAGSLARHGHPFALPRRPRRYAFLDAVLLEVLDRDPARLQEAFARLFATNPVEYVLAFLDEASTPAGDLRLISSLPAGPYLSAAVRRSARTARGPIRRCWAKARAIF